MSNVGMKCYKCGHWYLTTAHVETRMDTMEHGGVVAKFPRIMLSRWGSHDCKENKKKGKYSYDRG